MQRSNPNGVKPSEIAKSKTTVGWFQSSPNTLSHVDHHNHLMVSASAADRLRCGRFFGYYVNAINESSRHFYQQQRGSDEISSATSDVEQSIEKRYAISCAKMDVANHLLTQCLITPPSKKG